MDSSFGRSGLTMRASVDRVGMIAAHSNPRQTPGQGDSGGMTVYIRNVAAELAAHGVDVDIFTRGTEQTTSVFSLQERVRIVQLGMSNPGAHKEELLGGTAEFVDGVTQFAGRSGARYDVLHSHYWLSAAAAAEVAVRLSVPFVQTFHTLARIKNAYLRQGDRPEPLERVAVEQRAIDEASAIVASTPFEKRGLIQFYSAPENDVHLIPPGVDHSLFRPGDRAAAKKLLGLGSQRVLLFAGRLQPLKAADVAIKAVAELVSVHGYKPSQLKLLIVGGWSGPSGSGEPARLRELANVLGVSHCIEFWPAQEQAGLAAFYRAADVCVVPSHSETFGLVALEAMASGVPVVASKVGGLESLVADGVSGFLVPAGRSDLFAERVARLFGDADLELALRSQARIRAREYSWMRSATMMRGLYEKVTQLG